MLAAAATRAPMVAVASAVAGALFAGWLYGARVIDPRSLAWLLHGDPAQHLLGSVYFLREAWHWPPGLITGFGADPTSVVFTDSVPLLAFLAKALGVAPGLQYFGLWMLACHALAGFFAVRLLQRLGLERTVPLLAASLFFICAPVVLLRAYGHEALMGQFLVLWALERALVPWRWGVWLLLVALAVLVHPYLALMTSFIGLGAAAAARLRREVGTASLLAQGAFSALVLGALAWLAGYFAGRGDLSAAGHGFFSANLLTWFDPMDWATFTQQHQRAVATDREWSRFLPPLRQATAGQYEGFAYLGLGMLLLAGLALAAALRTRLARSEASGLSHSLMPPADTRRAAWMALVLTALLLALWAVSLRPTVGARVLADIEPGPALAHLLGVFRSSGRFIWPLTFLVMALALVRVAHLRAGTFFIVGALLLQGMDLSAKLGELRWRFHKGPTGIEQPLTDPLWPQALARCPRLEIVSADWPPPGWVAPTLVAALAGARVDPAPTARRSTQVDADHRRSVQGLIAGKSWREDTLYLLAHPMPGLDSATAQLPATHRLQRVDGREVILPRACLTD
jgi:hypothetical protein